MISGLEKNKPHSFLFTFSFLGHEIQPTILIHDLKMSYVTIWIKPVIQSYQGGIKVEGCP